MIAALYVQTEGCYFGLPGVDPWDQRRDARKYPGPHPVVAHPPCKRWGAFSEGPPALRHTGRWKTGDDGGCFAAALASVRKWGGVLEHPAKSKAWAWHGLNSPPQHGGWIVADFHGGWTCHVEQGYYGHKAHKPTWLYAVGVDLPTLEWGRPPDVRPEDYGYRPGINGGGGRLSRSVMSWLSKAERAATPEPFRDLLIEMARSVDR